MSDNATPEVHPNNTAYLFGTVDTAHGSNGQGLAVAAPHLFGDASTPPPAFEHLPHAVEFHAPELATAAAHMPGGVSTEVPAPAADPEDLNADAFFAAADRIHTAAQAAIEAREANDASASGEGVGDASKGSSGGPAKAAKAATKKAAAAKKK